MVGNFSWDFKGRDVGDCERKTTIVFAWIPRKTDKGWRWLTRVVRVSTIEGVPMFGSFFVEWFGVRGNALQEVIRYEALPAPTKEESEG